MRRSIGLVTAAAIAVVAGGAVLWPIGPKLRARGIAAIAATVAERAAANPRPSAGANAAARRACRRAGGGAARAVPDSREAIKLSFAPIVKRVAPAVVNVYATSRVQVRSPFEGDPFFERFFGGSPFGGPQRAAALLARLRRHRRQERRHRHQQPRRRRRDRHQGGALRRARVPGEDRCSRTSAPTSPSSRSTNGGEAFPVARIRQFRCASRSATWCSRSAIPSASARR